VAIVTNAGGPGILAADACNAAGLQVVPFSEATCAALRPLLPPMAAAQNPLDMIATAGPGQYRDAVATIMRAGEVDAVLILYTPVDAARSQEVLDAIRDGIRAGRAAGATGKTLLACLMADDNHPRLDVGPEHVPVYAFPENAARALGEVVRYAEWRRAPASSIRALPDIDTARAREICRGAIDARGDDWLTPEELRAVLAAVGIEMTPAIPTHTAAQAAATANALGYPVVAKLRAPGALHKSDVGGVVANLRSADDVERAFNRIAGDAAAHNLVVESIVIQPMVTGGVETVVGVLHDRLFGPLVGFGSGGIDVEVLDDVHFRIAPLTDRDIEELIGESRAATLMRGHRGRKRGDIASLADLIARGSRLAHDVPELAELDLNPVIVLPPPRGCHIVDARLRVAGPARRASALPSEAGA
jgi:acyl-CoA synthetase (NDP forming)